jgi:superfamily II DNA or RNA helicase
LKTQFAVHLLDECAGHWQQHRREHPRSKLLVVTANIEEAKKYLAHVKKQGIKAAIATSDDSALAAANIEKFRTVGASTSLDCLVTVAMAYEGLDVPAVTHIACLTHIRSKPWIEQMIARATRFDREAGPWESQTAFVYTPDDKNMAAIIGHMQAEQISLVKKQKEIEDGELPEPKAEPGERRTITPVGSTGGAAPLEPHRPEDGHCGRAAQASRPAAQRGRSRTARKDPEALPPGGRAVLRAQVGRNQQARAQDLRPLAHRMNLSQLSQVVKWLEYYYPVSK